MAETYSQTHAIANKLNNIIGQRHKQALLIFCCVTCTFLTRYVFTVAIVAMTDRNFSNPNFQVYAWGETTKSFVRSSFYFGYITTQIPGALVAFTIGSKQTIVYALATCAATSILSPLGTLIGGWVGLCILIIICGIGQGAIFPATHQLVAKWVPAHERTVLGPLAYSGTFFGATLIFSSGAYVTSSPIGWHGLFYITGGITILSTFLWSLWGEDSPETCKNITENERLLITNSLRPHLTSEAELKQLVIPWSEIFQSGPFAVLCMAHIGQDIFFWMILTEIIPYLQDVMDMKDYKIWKMEWPPFFGSFMMIFLVAALSYLINKKNLMPTAGSRIFFNSLGSWIPAILLISIGFVKPGAGEMACKVIIAAATVNACCYFGFIFNHIDLSPNFAGILMSITNFIANIFCLTGPILVKMVVEKDNNQLEWRVILYTIGFYMYITNVFFMLFGSFHAQSWNDPQT